MSEKKLSKEEIIEKLKGVNLKGIADNEIFKRLIETKFESKNIKKSKQVDINGLRSQNRDARMAKRTIKGIDTSFQFNDINNLPVIISSSVEIDVRIDYSPIGIIMGIEPMRGSNSTEISISGFGSTIYKYEDGYSNFETLTEEAGVVKFEQDIFKPHVILLKLNKSTYFLREDGWHGPGTIGTWDPVTRVAKLTTVVNDTIEIDTDYVKLDGLQPNNSKYKIDGSISGLIDGIYFNGRDNITISNVEIVNCGFGIRFENSDDITIKNNILSDNFWAGIALRDNRNVNISENVISDNDEGIELYQYNRNVIIEKNTISNGEYGVYFDDNNNSNKIINNTISKTDNLEFFYAIYVDENYNNHNLIEKNSINIINNTNIISDYLDFVGVYFYGDENSYNNISSNSIKILNNKVTSTGGTVFYSYLGGIELEEFNSGKASIKNNKIFIEDNGLVVTNSDMENYLYGIIIEFNYSEGEPNYVGGYVIESNNISIKRNNILGSSMGSYYMDNYISGIYIDEYIMGSNIKNNTIEIEGNSNATSTISSDTEVLGINFSYNNNGNSMEGNKISIKSNNFIDYIVYCGILVLNDNNGNFIKRNTVIIKNNSELNYNGRFICAIYLGGGNDGNRILENYLSNNQGNGIILSEYNLGNIIEGNKISNNEESGVGLGYNNNSNTIQKNYINNNQQGGLLLININESNDIFENEINNNKYVGIYIVYENNANRIKENNILSNDNYGIYFGDFNLENKVECNSIKNNNGYGIYLDNNFVNDYNENNKIMSNIISGNINGIYIASNNENNVIKYNNFIKGTGYNGYDNNALNVNEYYSNYWSDWSGVGPYYVNGYVDITGPTDPNPSKNQKNMCYKEAPVEYKPIKIPYECCHRCCKCSNDDCYHEYKKC